MHIFLTVVILAFQEETPAPTDAPAIVITEATIVESNVDSKVVDPTTYEYNYGGQEYYYTPQPDEETIYSEGEGTEEQGNVDETFIDREVDVVTSTVTVNSNSSVSVKDVPCHFHLRNCLSW